MSRSKDRISQNWKDWLPYPYKGHTLSNSQYIKDKNELFDKNGNGWWWNDGQGLNLDAERPMDYHRRKRKERGELK